MTVQWKFNVYGRVCVRACVLEAVSAVLYMGH